MNRSSDCCFGRSRGTFLLTKAKKEHLFEFFIKCGL